MLGANAWDGCPGAQVTLYEAPAAAPSLGEDFQLTMDTPVFPGMQMAAYYGKEHISELLVSRVQSAVAKLLEEPAVVKIQYSSHRSTVIYLKVLGALSNELLLGRLVDALQRSGEANIVLVKWSPDCVFEVQRGMIPF